MEDLKSLYPSLNQAELNDARQRLDAYLEIVLAIHESRWAAVRTETADGPLTARSNLVTLPAGREESPSETKT